MSLEEWKRLDAVKRVNLGELQIFEAAKILGVSERQLWNIRQKMKEQGARGVKHGLIGQRPWNKTAEEIRVKILEMRRGKYEGFNDSHFHDKLTALEFRTSRSTVRRILRGGGVGAVNKRRSRIHRRRRDRKEQEGLMLLWDGSRHDWLEGRGPLLCLMGAVDDATGKLMPGAHFVEQECAVGYLQVLLSICQEKGLPWSIYMDRHGSLKRNDAFWTLKEELQGEQEPTQVGKALKALGIEIIYALSPQAKGRVERLWGTLQDRLVSELRLEKICTKEAANLRLTKFIAEYNSKFSLAAKNETSAFRKPRNLDIPRLCSFYYEREVANDNTVKIGGQLVEIPPGPGSRSYSKARVEVRQLLDGSWRIYYQDTLIAKAASTSVTELRTLPKRKASAASHAFKKAVRNFSDEKIPKAGVKKGNLRRTSSPPPAFNSWRKISAKHLKKPAPGLWITPRELPTSPTASTTTI